jgi:hypothetical protein
VDTDAANPPDVKSPGDYEPPAIVWEQPFVALAQISPPICDPDSDPNCQP